MITRESISASRRVALTFLCLLALLFNLCPSPANSAGRGDWWMFRRDRQHTGRSPYIGTHSPVQQWKFTFKNDVNFTSSPAIGADGTIYIGSCDDNLYAINPVSGKQKWAFPPGIQSSPPRPSGQTAPSMSVRMIPLCMPSIRTARKNGSFPQRVQSNLLPPSARTAQSTQRHGMATFMPSTRTARNSGRFPPGTISIPPRLSQWTALSTSAR